MKKTPLILLFGLLIVFTVPLSAQITGFHDDFEDGSPDTLWNGTTKTLWWTNAEGTYGLDESNGVLNVDYNRSSSSTENDFIRFTSPENLDVSENPTIRLKIRSSVYTTITLRAVFGFLGGINQDFTLNVSGNNTWEDYLVEFDSGLIQNEQLNYLYFYFDKNSGTNRFGDVLFDDLRIAGFRLTIDQFNAETKNGNEAELTWTVNDMAGTSGFEVHRGNESDFEPSDETLVTESEATTFTQSDLAVYSTYFYRIIPVDTSGIRYLPSESRMIQTFDETVQPVLNISQSTQGDIGLFEAFELELDLEHVSIYNPYDPDDLDLYARFFSPTGDTLRINGFYDEYQTDGIWRIYFAPMETGSWSYQIFMHNIAGSDSTTMQTFDAVESPHHGPLRVSTENPDYLIHADGTPFYGLAVYYPWNVVENDLEVLRSYDLNMIGYWNGTYDGYGNGGGRYLFESIDSGLGRYDQRKMGRLEQILGWLEDRNMMLMYSIWAHPFLRDGEPGWDPIHFEIYNPYKEIVNATEFYSDSLAWEYQLKQYRYLIARFAHHRALGIWEIINEMHGTTGFIKDQNGALEWIDKMDAYLKEHDPYKRPTTASFGSVSIFKEKDIPVDIANRHYYETQTYYYPQPYEDAYHNNIFNLVNTYQGLKESGKRPAMFGEAGHTAMYFPTGSEGYNTEFHNALWSGLATGMASTPFWWDYTTKSIFTDEVMNTYVHLGSFVEDLDLSVTDFAAYSIERDDAYLYSMQNDTSAFGWAWKVDSLDISETEFSVTDLETGSFEINWYETWSGEYIKKDTSTSVTSLMNIVTPTLSGAKRDIAFKIKSISNGTDAYGLNLIVPYDIKVTEDQTTYPVTVFITDESGRLVEQSVTVSFTLSGNGEISQSEVVTTNGVATIQYTPHPEGGTLFSISAMSEGLVPAVVNNQMITAIRNEDESVIPSGFKLEQNYPNPFNPSTSINYHLAKSSMVKLSIYSITGQLIETLINEVKPAGIHSIKFDAMGLASGLYLYRLEAGSFIQTRKMALIK